MAACDLTVIIDEPKKARTAGEPVTGTVLVKSEKDVTCKALEVSSYWATHGQGNIARGEVESTTVFQGSWQAGQEYRYSFKLNSATWPPTYYGNYLNVSHFIGARAKVPWSTDPKTEAEFTISSATTPPDLSPTIVKKTSFNPIAWIFGGVFLVLILAFVAAFAIILVPIILTAGAVFWFFKIYLPKQLTGPVDLVVEPKTLKPGKPLMGSCQFTPRRNLPINGVTWTVKAIEKCVSGSGSDRKTHTHELLVKKIQLAENGTLPRGQLRKFDLAYTIPSGAPPSLKFSDNELTWSSELRIDIPKWPDWSKSIPFVVEAAPYSGAPPILPGDAPIASSASDDDPWLTEVLTQVHSSQDDPDRLKAVLEAIKSHVFKVNLNIQSEIDEPFDYEHDYSEDDDHEGEESEADDDDLDDDFERYWTTAIDLKRSTRIALLWPNDPDAFLWTDNWHGSAIVVGIDTETDRIMMRVVPDGVQT